jgi:hypothetical protein
MKTTILLLLMFITTIATAQFDGKTVETKLSTFTSPKSWDDGFSIGLQLNANFDFGGYISPEIYLFPNLKGSTYFHVGAHLGYNVFHNDNFRLFSGIFLGTVFRENKGIDSNGEQMDKIEPNGTFGLSSGIDYRIPDTRLFVGLDLLYQYRTDTAPRDPNYWRINGFVRVGLILN